MFGLSPPSGAFCVGGAGMPLKAGALPDVADLRALFIYEPESGALWWRASGKRAGSYSPRNKSLNVMIAKRGYLLHRIVWKLVHGEIPADMLVDHINGDRRDNRLSNLRLASNKSSVRNQGTRRDNKSGSKGVYYDEKARRFKAVIVRGGKQYRLGSHRTLDAAALAYKAAAVKFDGFYANGGEFTDIDERTACVSASFLNWRKRRNAPRHRPVV